MRGCILYCNARVVAVVRARVSLVRRANSLAG
ncbi:hypothetical protein M218_12995 [Burkholderia pseudomallei MSHR338]|nr:hypothetical protein M218_12995 [Burkholderia pseudomallei MSHR338]